MNIKEKDGLYIANTYARFPVTLKTGKGSLVYDDEGREYIDMATGIFFHGFHQREDGEAVRRSLCASGGA